MDKAELEKLCAHHFQGTCLYLVTQTWWDPAHKDERPGTPPCSLCYAWKTDKADMVQEYQLADRGHVSIYDVMVRHPEIRAMLPGQGQGPFTGGTGAGQSRGGAPADALATQEASSTTVTEERPRKFAWEPEKPDEGGTGEGTAAGTPTAASSAKSTSPPATETPVRRKTSHRGTLEEFK